MNGKFIKNLKEPTSGPDAATKLYVDTKFESITPLIAYYAKNNVGLVQALYNAASKNGYEV